MQSNSSTDESSMVCLSDFLDSKQTQDRWGGPGEVRALMDDGVLPGPGEEEEERRTDQIIRRRLLMMEETIFKWSMGEGEGWRKSNREGEGKDGY